MLKRNVGCVDWIEIGEDRFFSPVAPNIICRANSNESVVTVLEECDEKKVSSNPSVSSVAKCNNKLFFSRFYFTDLYVIDCDSLLTNSIPIDWTQFREPNERNVGIGKFWTNYVIGDDVYFFGWNSPAILKINSITLNVEYLSDWKGKVPETHLAKLDKGYYLFGFGYVTIGDYIYIASGVGSAIWKISKDCREIEYIFIDTDIDGFYSIAEYNGMALLTAKNFKENRMVLWNPTNHSSKEIVLNEFGQRRTPVIINNDIYVFPGYEAKNVLKIDSSTNECVSFEKLSKLFGGSSDDCCIGIKQNGSKVTFIRSSDNCWFTYDFETDELTEKYYSLPEDFFHDCEKEYYDDMIDRNSKSGTVMKEADAPLAEFIKRV